ncbi:peptidase inhibitor family I36 protein [Streptomyces sp. SB3404]|uniref:Peptidase inhibitor family I36 protein n=2 Tax=Streptomyces boncukensis TaxID=2711219 RepID=A0A6G4WZM6_9ACTN|nr:peptidase inhibitor family I36 protein [Streptomyces boncukensis]
MSRRLSTRLSSRVSAALAPLAAAALAATVLGVTAEPAQARPDRAAAGGAGAAPRLGECGAGELCLWERGGFRGARHVYELSRIDIESCEPLPAGVTAASLANRTGRPVTVYQSRECAETAEFRTHPTGSWTPETAYHGRAFKVWEN